MQASAQGDAASAQGRTFERVAEVRKLGGRKVPTAVVHAFAPGGAEVAVLERYTADAPSLEQLEKDARVAMSLRHPNVAAVRDVWREGGELCIASEWVEGETLEELRRLGAGGKDLSIEVGVRIIVDLLGALSALHTLGAGGLAHGEVTTTTVIVGMMERRWGRVISITSASVKAAMPMLGLSTAARAGLTGFTATLAREVAPDGVTVNNLLPGFFETSRLQRYFTDIAAAEKITPEQARALRVADVPVRRPGNPEEFGTWCAFLASVHSGYITGQNILLDGGAFPGVV